MTYQPPQRDEIGVRWSTGIETYGTPSGSMTALPTASPGRPSVVSETWHSRQVWGRWKPRARGRWERA